MTAPALWTWDELVAAAGGVGDGAPERPVTGFSIDSRALAPGEVFVALTDQRDGHAFVGGAFAAGAAAAVVSAAYRRGVGDGALVRVADPLRALERVGQAARRRVEGAARVVAITGSVGKTGTKEMLKACLATVAATHAPEKSFNNQWGVPLTLARMPKTTRFGVFEIGMNRAGEIAPLTRLVRPHVAVVTAVGPVHLEFFASVAAIADAKAEIFLGLEPAGSAILDRDSPHFRRLAAHAQRRRARLMTFGQDSGADVHPQRWELGPDGARIVVSALGRSVAYRLGVPGEHIAHNSLAVVAALAALGVELEPALGALAAIAAPPGRGQRVELEVPGGRILLIDESYNANPASMRAALATLAGVPRQRFGRRIAVLGDMLELGPDAGPLHRALEPALTAARVDLVFACGPQMRHLFDLLRPGQQACWAETSVGLEATLVDGVAAGDVVMVKGSLGSRMAPLVEALKHRFACRQR